MENQHSQKYRQQRKFLLVAPILVLPFLCMFFWALGGGKGVVGQRPAKAQKGLNLDLPNARLKEEKSPDKMAFYEKADQDSARLKERLKNEAFYEDKLNGPGTRPPVSVLPVNPDSNENKVYSKLNELNKVLSNPPLRPPVASAPRQAEDPLPSEQIDRLEKMLMSLKGGADDPDPEMSRLNSTLDKLVAVQHPEILNDSLRSLSKKNEGNVFPVSRQTTAASISYLQEPNTDKNAPAKHSYQLKSPNDQAYTQNTIQAVIPEQQTLVNGAIVRLELSEPLFIAGISIPAGSKIYGTASLNNERLLIVVSSIRAGNNIYPVSLQVFDVDGVAGVYVPGAISRDVAKQSADQSINGLTSTTLDPSFGAQAASAGLDMARNIITRKIKLIRVTIKAGYRVFLKDAKQQSTQKN